MTYSKVIGLLVSAHTVKLSGGIGTFIRSTYNVCEEHNWKLVVITDKAPNTEGFEGIEFIYPSKPLPNNKHQESFPFDDSFSFEKGANMREALLKAHGKYLFDAIIANNLEAYMVGYFSGLCDVMPLMYYTHDTVAYVEKNNSPFIDSYHSINNLIYKLPDILIATHTKESTKFLKERKGVESVALPIVIDTKAFFDIDVSSKRNGVLFIGTNDDRKNFKEFLRFCTDNNEDMLILTSSASKRRMEKVISDSPFKGKVQFLTDSIGEDKVHFLSKAKYSYVPSKDETFGLSVLEAMYSCPTIVADRYYTRFHSTEYDIVVKTDNDAEDIQKVLAVDMKLQQKSMLEVYHRWVKEWETSINYVREQYGHKSTKLFDEIGFDSISVSDYLFELKNRVNVSFSDLYPLYNQFDSLHPVHTSNGTVLTKDGNIGNTYTNTSALDEWM